MSKIERVTNEYINSVNEIMETAKGNLNDDILMNMSVEDFKLMKSCYRLIETTNELAVAYSETLTDISNKLDKLNDMLLNRLKES